MFDLEKLINDIAKFQKVRIKDAFHDWAEVKAKNVKKNKKEITIKELEVECEDALNKLIEKDKDWRISDLKLNEEQVREKLNKEENNNGDVRTTR